MPILVELTPLDPVAGSRATVRASSAQDRKITGLNGVKWPPAISELPSLGMKLFDGDFSSVIDPGSASLALRMDALEITDPNVRRYAWAGARLTIYSGESGDAWPWEVVFKGIVDRFEASGNSLKLTAEVDQEPFKADALTLTYAGTGGAEGGADLKNKVKPWVFGRALNVEPVLINAVDNVFQFSAYGPIQAVTALYERAADFGASVGDYASYAALVAATIPPGRWATCLAEGMIRLGAPPFGVITGDIEGDKPSTWLRKTGEIIDRIAINAGVSVALIDSASLAALDTAVSRNINLVLTEQITVLDLAQRLARPCNAQAGVGWTGKLFVVRPTIGSPAITLDGQGRRRPAVSASTELDVRPPYWRVEMGGQRAWRVHSFDEVAFTAPLVERGRYDPAETYREGHITDLADGSRWLYINPVPSSGHAPPSGLTEDGWWQQLVGPRAYADGTLIEDLKPAEPGATQGAPDGTNVGGVPAETVISDRAVAGETLISQALNGYSERRRVMALLHLNGRPIRAIAEIITEARVDELGNAFARAGFEVDANGIIGGLFLTSDGRLVDFRVAADKFQIVRPGTAGTDPNDILLSVEGTKTLLHDVEVDTLKVRTVTPAEMDEGAIGERALQQDAAAVGVTSTTEWTNVQSVQIIPQYGNPIIIDFTAWMVAPPGDGQTYLYLRVVRDDGTPIYGGSGGNITKAWDEGGALHIRCISGSVKDRPTTFTLQAKKAINTELVNFQERIALADEESRVYYQTFELAGNAAGEGPTAGTGGGGSSYNPNPYERSSIP